jgi:DNA-directed RNA polymerase subunit L
MQKIVIHTVLDLINSILEVNSKKEKSYIYEYIATKFFIKLNTVYDNKISKDTILITRLRPGEHLHLTANIVKRTGRDNASFNPVSLANFSYIQDPVEANKCDNILDKERAYYKNNYGDPIKFKFDIEYINVNMGPKYLIPKSLDIITHKLNNLITELANIEISDVVKIQQFQDIKETYEFIIENEDDTLGNIIQSFVHNKYIREKNTINNIVCKFIGYICPHPLKSIMIIRVTLDSVTDANMFISFMEKVCKEIIEDDVTAAFEKVAIGPERKSKVMNDKEKEMTAYHEAGHAIVGHVLPDSDMVHKVTIIPRGGTGGVTWFIPPEDKSYHSILEYKDILARMLGGRIAEEVVYGKDRVTTGAGNDLQKAAELARDMVINQGMGSKLRNQVFHVDEGMMMERLVHERQYSDETAKIIDDEVESLITEAARRARDVIKANRSKLEELKDRLIKKETVEAKEVLEVLKGSKLPPSAANS